RAGDGVAGRNSAARGAAVAADAIAFDRNADAAGARIVVAAGRRVLIAALAVALTAAADAAVVAGLAEIEIDAAVAAAGDDRTAFERTGDRGHDLARAHGVVRIRVERWALRQQSGVEENVGAEDDLVRRHLA